MVKLDALKQAITDLERLISDGQEQVARATIAVLARMYTTYAQATLEAHGISIDLPALCGDHLIHHDLMHHSALAHPGGDWRSA